MTVNETNCLPSRPWETTTPCQWPFTQAKLYTHSRLREGQFTQHIPSWAHPCFVWGLSFPELAANSPTIAGVTCVHKQYFARSRSKHPHKPGSQHTVAEISATKCWDPGLWGWIREAIKFFDYFRWRNRCIYYSSFELRAEREISLETESEHLNANLPLPGSNTRIKRPSGRRPVSARRKPNRIPSSTPVSL